MQMKQAADCKNELPGGIVLGDHLPELRGCMTKSEEARQLYVRAKLNYKRVMTCKNLSAVRKRHGL